MALSFSCNSKLFPQHQGRFFLLLLNHFSFIQSFSICLKSLWFWNSVRVSPKSNKCLDNVRNLVKTVGIPSVSSSPLESLRKGNWVKLICGASFEVSTKPSNLTTIFHLYRPLTLRFLSLHRMLLISGIFPLSTLLLEVKTIQNCYLALGSPIVRWIMIFWLKSLLISTREILC